VTGTSLERLLRRDRLIVLAALAVIVLLAVLCLLSVAAPPDASPMNGMAMDASHFGPRPAPWSGGHFLMMFAMWAAMMVGMMTPSVAPMLLIYVRVARHAEARAQPFAPVGWFAMGYLLAWSAFAAVATLLQWLLDHAALMDAAMAIADQRVAGFLLIAAGFYQWTPLKDACLGRCRSPFQFIQAYGGFRPEPGASLLLGLRHGFYCIGCCWALMLLLFFGGVMNLLWVAALAAFVLAEKLVPRGRFLSRAAGAALIAGGASLIAGLL